MQNGKSFSQRRLRFHTSPYPLGIPDILYGLVVISKSCSHRFTHGTGSKYVPPHLRNQGGGGSNIGGSSKYDNDRDSEAPNPVGGKGGDGGHRSGYGSSRMNYGPSDGRSNSSYSDRRNTSAGDRSYDNRAGGRDGMNPRASAPPSLNSRWENVDPAISSGGGRGGYDGGGGYSGERRSMIGGYGRGGGGGHGPRVNQRGFHGDMRPDPRLEKELFEKDDQQTTGINFDRYDNIPVETSGHDIPDPIDAYTIDTIGEDLMRNTQLCGYHKPTPVQKYSIPIASAGRDLMAW
jgi:ATP-dependent RNA helicase DDX3X